MADSKRILIVDDDFEIALFLKTTFEVLWPHYKVVNVPSGEEGLLELPGREVDLVVTDINLPGIDGLVFIERIRRRTPDMPIIAITGERSRKMHEQVEALDLAGFFIKPIQVDDITAVVRQVFNEEAPALPVSETPAVVPIPPRLGRHLSGLRVDTGAEYAMFVDMNGHPLLSDGRVSGLDVEQVATILARDLASTSELAQLLRAPQPLTISYQAGADHDLYTANVGASYLLVLVFSSQRGRGKIGVVWVYARRVVREMLDILKEQAPMPEAEVELVEAEPLELEPVIEAEPEIEPEPVPEPELEPVPDLEFEPFPEPEPAEPIEFPDLVPADELTLDASAVDVDSFWDTVVEEDESSVREGMSWEEAQAQGLIPGGVDLGE